jgi:muramoyltetrapeptide carboxypeptidase
MRRRLILGGGLAGLAGMVTHGSATAARTQGAAPVRPRASLKAPRLRPGDVVGVVNPSSAPAEPGDARQTALALAQLGLQVRSAPHLTGAASDAERAGDLNGFFADPAIQAVLALRGGWGCARLLEHVDYDLIVRHPKVVMGYSDVDALLLAIRSRTGLVTFHGPMAISAWDPFTAGQVRSVLLDAQPAVLTNPEDTSAQEERPCTIRPGRARGRLWGGNLTVLTSMLGSDYLAVDDDLVLFLEEVREPASEIDRMLTQLKMAGILGRARAVVIGQLAGCAPPRLDPTLTLDRVLADHLRPLNVPAWRGAMFGHVARQYILPVGLPVEADAERGTIRLLERAVS